MTVKVKAAATAAAAAVALGGAVLFGGTGLAAAGSTAHHPGAVRNATPTPTPAAKCPNGAPTVTVDGYGTAQAAPNQLTISLGVQTQSTNAAAALSANSAKANALVDKLRSDGVPAVDMQTSNLSIQPVYNPKQVITGYQVNNTLTVTLLQLSSAGSIIDDAAQVAGNSVLVNNIAFSVQNDGPVLAKARAAAVRQATAQAQAMAAAAGMALGPLCSLQDNTGQPQPLSLGAAAPSAARSTPVEPGQQTVSADVTAVYELGAPAST